MDEKIDEKTIIKIVRLEYNPILDVMKTFTEKDNIPISVIYKYSVVKDNVNPFIFNVGLEEYLDLHSDEEI